MTVASGGWHTLALKANKTLWSWGADGYGCLGLGGTGNQNAPQPVGLDSDWVSIATGEGNSYAVKSDGTLWAWGLDLMGQLGDGGSAYAASTPTKVGTDTDWSMVVSTKGYYAVAIKSDGTLWAWGNNQYGQLGLGNYVQYATPQRIGGTVTATRTGLGSGVISGTGLTCSGNTCTGIFEYRPDTLLLNATADSNSSFAGWLRLHKSLWRHLRGFTGIYAYRDRDL